MNEQEIKIQIETLQREYKDLRTAISSLSSNLNNNAILRGTLSGAGVSAESILKSIIRLEKINIKTIDSKIPVERANEIRKKEVQGLMLDEMIRLTENRLPLRIITHLRTIQAWRNIGSHDKGEHQINETINSNTLQVVSLALSELVTWFVGEYLNHDISGFYYNEELPKVKKEILIDEWQEEFWFAMRKGLLKALDEAKLNKTQHIHNISNEAIDFIKSNFERKEELFIQILNEAFDDGIIDIDELEAIEHSRKMFCISSKETKEILEKFNWKSKFKDNPEKLNVDWMRDELVSYRQLLESNVDNELLNKTKIDDLDSSPLSNIDIKKSYKDFGIQIQETDKHSLTNNIITSDSIEFKEDDKLFVKIGNQLWARLNLSVEHFNNGDKIEQLPSNLGPLEFMRAKKPYWTFVNFNPETLDKFGRLYNFFAVNDKRGIVPDGFRIPTIDDWTKLSNHLGDNAGFKLKNSENWNKFGSFFSKSDGNGNNDSGFTANPSGTAYSNKQYLSFGDEALFWSSEQVSDYSSHSVSLKTYSDSLHYTSSSLIYFLSIRYLRDI